MSVRYECEPGSDDDNSDSRVVRYDFSREKFVELTTMVPSEFTVVFTANIPFFFLFLSVMYAWHCISTTMRAA